jgi:hypothetical protein
MEMKHVIEEREEYSETANWHFRGVLNLDVVGGPSTLNDPDSDAGRSLSSW